MRMRERGYTILELMVASTIGFLVLMAAGKVDLTRVLLTDEIRRQARMSTEVGWAVSHMVLRLERADRLVLVNAGATPRLQVRIPEMDTACAGPVACAGVAPPACCFSVPQNYRWVQYSRLAAGGGRIAVYDDMGNAGGAPPRNCTVDATFLDIGSFTINFMDESPAALAGEPLGAVQDSNVVEVIVAGVGANAPRYRAEVTMRGGAYTNVNLDGAAPFNVNCASAVAGPCDTGTGVASAAGIAAPAAACP